MILVERYILQFNLIRNKPIQAQHYIRKITLLIKYKRNNLEKKIKKTYFNIEFNRETVRAQETPTTIAS